MKIFYFGTVCDLKEYESFISLGKIKPSVAGIVFESSLLKGFKELDVDMDIYTYPMFPTFPTFPKLFLKKKVEKLDCGYNCT